MQNTIQQIPASSADNLDHDQRQKLTLAVQGLSRQQLNWASGYLAGLSQNHQPVAAAPVSKPLTIIYSSQTGNAQAVAQSLSSAYQQKGIASKLVSAGDYKPRDLAKESIVLLVISTQGDGEAPESAYELQQYLFGKKAPDLKSLKFSVFGLGDSSYPDFCQAGKDFDAQLEALGAERLLDRVDADLDFESFADDWQEVVLAKASEWVDTPSAEIIDLNTSNAPVLYNRNNPYTATVLENRRITTPDALSDTHHIEIEIDANHLSYQPGDSLGVWVRNNSDLVANLISTLSLDADTQVQYKKESISLQSALETKLEITQLHPSVISKWAAIAANDELNALAGDKDAAQDFSANNQFIDLAIKFPQSVDAQAVVDLLLPLQPRLYSISSSQLASEDEVHLTITSLAYQSSNNETRLGSASQYLNSTLNSDDVIDVYVVENTQFRLPSDASKPIIMIGAGTGIAPFRSFLQQREELEASGENWLVFGNRNFNSDFLYQTDWQKWRKDGLLNRVSLAFSRDSAEKVYVQDRLLEEAETLYQWLQDGAYLYVCGSIQLEQEIHTALTHIVQQHAELNKDEAETYVNNLRSEGRYLRDVY